MFTFFIESFSCNLYIFRINFVNLKIIGSVTLESTLDDVIEFLRENDLILFEKRIRDFDIDGAQFLCLSMEKLQEYGFYEESAKSCKKLRDTIKALLESDGKKIF